MQLNESKKTQLTKKQRFFIPILLRSRNLKSACEQAGIDRSTWWRWNQEPGFQDALAEEKTRLVSDAMDTLRLNLAGAYDVVVGLMGSRDESVALRAAVALSEIYLKAVTVSEIEARLENLEKAQQEQQ
jgi:hypothetical protein